MISGARYRIGRVIEPPQDDDDHELRAEALPAAPLERRLVARLPTLAFALRGLDGRATSVMLWSALLLLVFRKFGGSGYFESTLRPDALKGDPYLSVYGDYYWFLSCFFLLGVLPKLLSSPRGLRPPETGTGLGDWRFGLRWVGILSAVMVPVVLVASRFSTFWRYYPINNLLGVQAAAWLNGDPGAPEGFVAHFLGYELLYGLYFVGWEYFFRGYMTFGLYARMGVNGILVANIPFALLHLGKPFPEALGSIVAGIALGLFALRARSFWYCAVIHILVAWTMDLASILRRAQEVAGG